MPSAVSQAAQWFGCQPGPVLPGCQPGLVLQPATRQLAARRAFGCQPGHLLQRRGRLQLDSAAAVSARRLYSKLSAAVTPKSPSSWRRTWGRVGRTG